MGEVAKALRGNDAAAAALELSDLVAWTASLAVLCGVDLDRAMARYARGCPRCGASPCRCPADGDARADRRGRHGIRRLR